MPVPKRSLLLLLVAILPCSCAGGDSMVITVSPSATGAVNDGQTPTQVVATITASGSPAPDGTSVSFTVDSSTGASFAPIAAGTPSTQIAMSTTASGKATVEIYDLGVEAVTLTVTATIIPANGNAYSIAGTATVTFGGVCKDSFVTAKPKSLNSGVAVHLDFTCDSTYLGGIFPFDVNHFYQGNTMGCRVQVSDSSMQGLQGQAVQFLTEAGTFETDVQTTGQHPTELTDMTGTAQVQYHVSTPYPTDVEPDTRDGILIKQVGSTATIPRAWTGIDPSNPMAMRTYNPRDGWVTMIAAAAGISTEPTPEPYVDSNDNGMWDLGEPYIDVNCSGSFDAVQTPDSNGFIRLWTPLTIVWVDAPWAQAESQGYQYACSEAYPNCIGSEILGDSPTGCSSQTIGTLQECKFIYRFVDRNLNLPSTYNGMMNQIVFSSTMQILTPTLSPIPIGPSASSYVLGTDFTADMKNNNMPPAPNIEDCSVTAEGDFFYGDPSITGNGTLLEATVFKLITPANCSTP